MGSDPEPSRNPSQVFPTTAGHHEKSRHFPGGSSTGPFSTGTCAALHSRLLGSSPVSECLVAVTQKYAAKVLATAMRKLDASDNQLRGNLPGEFDLADEQSGFSKSEGRKGDTRKGDVGKHPENTLKKF